uniref:BV12-like n=1 Tax=Cotesia sesamiae Kitale bracovirus TaxID=452648 RepID=S0DJ79_9VIRU|nr:BV12-like [Cotesia sesamiae Kitale bracovirus]
MNEYQALTPDIQVPKEWPVDGLENIVTFLIQDVINCHRSGKKVVMTVNNVSAVIKENRAKPGFLLKKIKEIKDEDTYRIDLIIPSKIIILKHANIGPSDKKAESIDDPPMNLKFDHPITKLISTNLDRHMVATLVPDVEKILLLKGIIDSEKEDYIIQATYRVHDIKWLDDSVYDIETGQSTTESAIVDAQKISKNKWDIVCYSYLSQYQ